jgi:branched-chain amino acid transport system substrate-binding protein
MAVSGEFARAGREVALDEAGFMVAGRRVELVVEDTAFRPEVAVTKVRKLVEQDRIHLLLGPQSSAVALAIRDYMVSRGLPWILTVATAPSLTREHGARNLFRTAFSAEQFQYAAGAYVSKKLGYRKVSVLGLDYVGGRAEAGAFMEGFQAAGGEMVQPIWIPQGTSDPAPFITRIRPETTEAVILSAVWGSDAVRVIKGLDEYGLKGRRPVIATYGAVDDGMMLPSLGSSALGMQSYGVYAPGLETPENARFSRLIRDKTGKPANLGAYLGYLQARVAMEALKAVNGEVEDTDRYLKALARVELVGPAGPFKFDKNQNATVNIYFQEVKLVDGQLRNVVLDVVARGVTQR